MDPGVEPTVGQLWHRWNYNTSLAQGADVISVECRVASIDFAVRQAKADCRIHFFGRFDNGGMFAPLQWENKPGANNIPS